MLSIDSGMGRVPGRLPFHTDRVSAGEELRIGVALSTGFWLHGAATLAPPCQFSPSRIAINSVGSLSC